MPIINASAEAYYADQIGDVPTLNQSTAKVLLQKSPLHAWIQHPRLGGQKREPSKTMDRGTVVHALLLEESTAGIVELPYPDYRTKAAQADRDAIYASGMTPMLSHEMNPCRQAVDAIRRQLESYQIKLSGKSEQTFCWTEMDDGDPVLCRSRLDHVIGRTIIDLKTTGDGHPDAVQKAYVAHGYDIQLAAYTRALAQHEGCEPEDIDFVNVVCEMEPPYITQVFIPDNEFRQLGTAKWLRAVSLWNKCLKSDQWPPYSVSPVVLTPPVWAVKNEERAA